VVAGVGLAAQYAQVAWAEERQTAEEVLESKLVREHAAAALGRAVLGSGGSTLSESGKVAQGYVLAEAKRYWDGLRGPWCAVVRDWIRARTK
jgi:hypothetical protein